MKKIVCFLLLFSGVAKSADKVLWAPSGDWKILTTTGQKVNLNDSVYADQNGLSVVSGKVLKADSIQTTAGSPPPGFVPIGGMVAVMPNTHANAWQPPVSGAIKDGFMRADGSAVPTCSDCIIPAGTVLPNMVTKYPRGNTASGATGGSNLYTPAGTNADSNVPATGLTFSGTSGTYSVSVPGHYHGMGTGATFSVSIGHNHGSENFTSGGVSANHTHSGNTSTETNNQGGLGITYWNESTTSGNWVSGASYGANTGTHYHGFSTGNQSADHSHTTTVDLANFTGSGSVSGLLGLVTGGQNGNGPFTATGSNTPAGSITGTATAAAQAFTGTQGNNEPAYVEVVWVIRVK